MSASHRSPTERAVDSVLAVTCNNTLHHTDHPAYAPALTAPQIERVIDQAGRFVWRAILMTIEAALTDHQDRRPATTPDADRSSPRTLRPPLAIHTGQCPLRWR